MKKAFIGLLILILSAWAQYVFSAEPIQLARMNPYVAGGAGAASCSTGTIDQSNNTSGIGTIVLPSSFAGQSFVVSKTGYIHSVKVRGIGHVTGNGTFTLRIGNNIDLTSYWKEVQVMVNIVESEEQTIIFTIQDTEHSVITGNTYYFAISENSAGAGFQFYIGSGYASGTVYWSADSNKWDLFGHDDPFDMMFDVLLCD